MKDKALLYKTIEQRGEGLYKEKGSKFLGFIEPCLNETAAKNIIQTYRARYHDARHHCFAYRLGIETILERANDDGEPSGTAGKPILGQLHSFDLTNVVAVVVRYFGGTKLGVGGLITAYKSAIREAILNTTIVTKELKQAFLIQFSYAQMGSLMSFLNKHKISFSDIKMENTCSLIINLSFGEEHYLDDLQHSLQITHISKLTP